MPTLFLVLAAWSLLVAVNAVLPRKWRLAVLPSFFLSWLTIELAPWWLGWHAVAVTALVAVGGLEETIGWVALALSTATAVLLVVVIVVSRRTVVIMQTAIGELDTDGDAPPFPRSHVAFPVLMRRRSGVRRTRNIAYAEVHGKRLRLDVYQPLEPLAPGSTLRPGVLVVHGGAWVMGDKREQGIPLVNHLAANGWVAINANYRLSPRVAFPTHLIDLKRAIAWYRQHAHEFGADPEFLCVTGNSAGGHLSTLLALTANDPEYQPGFEDVDTTLRAAVPFYGIYDFTNRFGTWDRHALRRFFEPIVMKTRLADDPDAFAKASPIDRVHPGAPPFFVVHGSRDVLAPVEDARAFVAALRAVSKAPVLYAEIQGAQHAFDTFPSFRTARVIEGVERFVHSVHAEYLRGRTGAEVREAKVADELIDR